MGSHDRDTISFVSVTCVECRPARVIGRAALVLMGALVVLGSAGCGDKFFPTTVDPGSDFEVADVVFNEGYFYCKVEPVLFANSCGTGDPSKGDTTGGCHFSATTYRLSDYSPRIGDSCGGGTMPTVSNVPDAAKHNYETSQARMKRDPDLAPLLQRPTGNQAHPRQIFDLNSTDADAIRQWATQFANQ